MEVRITCGLWLLVFLSGCAPFNLDTEDVMRKTGEPGSLFGYSLALHRQLKPTDKRMLLVGAPQAKALSGQRSLVTGGVFRCDINSSPGCSRIIFDNDEDTRRESKENQWMGVTVASQGPGGKVLACAHRYQRRNNVKTLIESREISGRCYSMSQDLTIDPQGGDGDGGSWHFCAGRSRGHEMFGSCQQGLSAVFDKDYHYLIFGAPGAYNWKGVVRVEQKNDSLEELDILYDGPYEVGDEQNQNPNIVPAASNSYMGFSLDSGMALTTKGQLTVVAGAPRANHSGSVVLLKTGGPLSNILVAEHTFDGEGLASSFGYDVTVLDLNKDGWEDIVVGAPQYFEKDSEIGGAVYIYVNKKGKWNEVTPIRINGPDTSMFGLCVENLGDINQDGFHDFAVGAPYDEAGKVFIFHGSKEGISSTTAAQVLSGESLGVGRFGYSLAGNMDLDGNFYPDLAVGSLSDAVFVFKARPVVDITKEINFSPTQIDLTNKNCGSNFCLTIEACFSYTANPANYAPKLTVAYALTADADQVKKGLSPRATFTEPADPAVSYESKGTIAIEGKGKRQCITRQLVVQENIRDKLRGIPIDVSVEIVESKRKRRQSGGSPGPVMDANKPNNTRSEVEFAKEGCGSDNVCQSNLQVKYHYGTMLDKVTFTPFALDNDVPVISLNDQQDIALEVKVTNMNGDDAHEASVIASLPRALTYSTYHSLPVGMPVTCTANKNGSQATCELGNPFKHDAETTFYIMFATSGISPEISEVEVGLELQTTSSQQKKEPVKAKAKVAIVLQLSITGQVLPSQVYFTGKVKGETAMKTERDIGSAITHQFRVINLVKRLADFGTATLDIDWPKEDVNGKWLLYLMKINITGLEGMQCTPKGEVNPLNKEPVSARSRREAGRARGAGGGTVSRLLDKQAKTLSCSNGAKCVRITCPLKGMGSNLVVTLHSRLWNSTFIEDYSKIHRTEVIVNAALNFQSTTKKLLLKNEKAEVKLTVFPERHEARYGGVPWWIIVLSILLFLLLLGLLAFLLWKCGFYERAKYEDGVPSYSAVRIRREERTVNWGNNWENVEKKPWMTTWHDNKHYS